MTLAEAREIYRAHLVKLGRAPATIEMRLYQAARFGCFLRERQIEDLRAVTRYDVDAYGTAIAARYIPSTCAALLGMVKGFFGALVAEGKLLSSPAEHVKHRQIERLLGPVLTEDEVSKLMASENTGLPAGIRNRALLELLYATGLRRKEVCGLAVADIEVNSGMVRVRHGKGDKERLVPLTRAAQCWLGEYLREVRPRFAKKGKPGESRVFLSVFGRALDPATLTTMLQYRGRVAGIKHVSCHAFRRTMATALLRGGADVRVVSEILGHATLDPTERYTKVVLTDLHEVQARTHPRAQSEDHDRA